MNYNLNNLDRVKAVINLVLSVNENGTLLDYPTVRGAVEMVFKVSFNELEEDYMKDIKQEFMFYHKHRNDFNIAGNSVTNLKKTGDKRFIDNYNRLWTEASPKENFFHSPKADWFLATYFDGKPYSRKFLAPDTGVLKGEFEMIIRHDGVRITKHTNEEYMETYNFGRTLKNDEHLVLDVEPHYLDSNYAFPSFIGPMSTVSIIDD